MGVKANLSIWGMYVRNDTIFDDMSIPTQVDRSILKDNILEECSEMQLLYTNWDFLKSVIDSWSARMLPTWQRIANALDLEYNPIENYNRNEDYFDTIKHTGTENSDGAYTSVKDTDTDLSNTYADSGTNSNTRNTSENETNTNDITTTEKVNGFNGDLTSQSMQPKSQQVTDQDQGRTGQIAESASGTTSNMGNKHDVFTDDTTIRDENHDLRTLNLQDTYEHHAHLYGNIGVTTSQEMVEAEIKVAQHNIYTIIIDDFKKKFCLSVYF
jgi:hypothetical protein